MLNSLKWVKKIAKDKTFLNIVLYFFPRNIRYVYNFVKFVKFSVG